MSKTEELFKEAGVIRLEKTVLQIGGQEDILVKQLFFIIFYVIVEFDPTFYFSTLSFWNFRFLIDVVYFDQ